MIELYPFESFRPGAKEALEKADKAFSDGKRFVQINALTGTGKSGFAVACARKYKACILTPTKILQNQYANTEQFNKEYTIFGKSNYKCGIPGLSHMPVDQAICVSDIVADNSRALVPFGYPSGGKAKPAKMLKIACSEQHICPYYTKIYNIGKVPGAILNYDLFFKLKKYPGQSWGTDMGDTIVFDEAHQLVDKVKDHFGFKFSDLSIKRVLGDDSGKRASGESPVDWLKRLVASVGSRLILEEDSKQAAKYDSFIKKANHTLEQDLEDEKKFFIEDLGTEIEIKPLDLRYLTKKIFYPFKRIMLLSATFPSNFKEILGISSDECETIDIPSSFPKAKRPVMFCKDSQRLNKDSILRKDSQTIELLNQILATHARHKGIIHTGNYKFMEQLRPIYSKNKRFLWVTKEQNKTEIMDKHLSSKEPTVLVSPSMMEGVDLKDDAARFGVMLKVPYPMLDDYTKRMMAIFPSWYDNIVATNICQAYGRQVRNEFDWARFYIIDGAFDLCMTRSKKCYSPYFLEALKTGTYNALMQLLKNEESKL